MSENSTILLLRLAAADLAIRTVVHHTSRAQETSANPAVIGDGETDDIVKKHLHLTGQKGDTHDTLRAGSGFRRQFPTVSNQEND